MRVSSKYGVILLGLCLWSIVADARPQYAEQLPPRLRENCGVCHLNPMGGGGLNAYGNAFQSSGNSVSAIGDQDSDGDGAPNAQELSAGSLPGDPSSVPGTPAQTPVSLNAQVGIISLVFGFLAVLYGLVLLAVAFLRSDFRFMESIRRAVVASFVLSSLSTFALALAFVQNDFQVEYVATHSNRTMPWYYQISGVWGGQEGSLLFWLFILAAYSFFVGIRQNIREDPKYYGYFYGTQLVSQAFFYSLLLFVTPPFKLIFPTPPDGAGLNPQLQSPAMLFHPPLLYLGYVGMAVPFGFAMAALLSGKMGKEWVKKARFWVMLPWTFLTIGIVLGGAWAYTELGWGGYWAWDPVENASFMPWLTSTAFLHSIMVQERRRMLRTWNFVLIFLSYWLALLGTFITRSGLISSVHSFANTGLGMPFIYFMLAAMLAAGLAIFYRYPELAKDERLESPISREGSFLLNNWILVSILAVVLYGTMYPIFSEALTGKRGDLGAPYYNTVSVPLFLMLLLVTGFGPILTWGKASLAFLKRSFSWPLLISALIGTGLYFIKLKRLTPSVGYSLSAFVILTALNEYKRGISARKKLKGEFGWLALKNLILKNRRRYGGFIVHIGIATMAIGITASSAFKISKEVNLSPGESYRFLNYELQYQGLSEVRGPGYTEIRALLQAKAGRKEFMMTPARRVYDGLAENTSNELAITVTPTGDYYFVLVGWNEGGTASFQMFFNPLISWIWVGALLMLAGSLIALTHKAPSGPPVLA
ncbi:MAG: heme lyase CcmF/NrfE family subunit [bacterium JZ-2024 1]